MYIKLQNVYKNERKYFYYLEDMTQQLKAGSHNNRQWFNIDPSCPIAKMEWKNRKEKEENRFKTSYYCGPKNWTRIELEERSLCQQIEQCPHLEYPMGQQKYG